MIYVAMFDEVDEGTAMFKLAETQSQVPVQGKWVTLDADGTELPSDWYLRLGGAVTKMLRHQIGLTSTIPFKPGAIDTGGMCVSIGDSCSSSNACCNGHVCVDGACCVAIAQTCSSDSQCCNGHRCQGGACCVRAGQGCGHDAQCCSRQCTQGVCVQ
jgi:hypothetical protein